MRKTSTRRSCRTRAVTCGPAAADDPDVVLIWRRGQGWESRLPAGDPRADILDLYLPLCSATPARPITVGHLGQSVDGFIATHSGDSQFVTGRENIVHLHALRALCDAVVVGAGTVAADDPQLTTRHVAGPHPLRVVFDPTRRLAPTFRVFTEPTAPTLYVCEQSRVEPGETQIVNASVAGIDPSGEGGAVGALLRLLARTRLRPGLHRRRRRHRLGVSRGQPARSPAPGHCAGAHWGGPSGDPAGGARPPARLRASSLSGVQDGWRRAVRLRPRGQRPTRDRGANRGPAGVSHHLNPSPRSELRLRRPGA